MYNEQFKLSPAKGGFKGIYSPPVQRPRGFSDLRDAPSVPSPRTGKRKSPQTPAEVKREFEERSASFLGKALRAGRAMDPVDKAVFAALAGLDRLPYAQASDMSARGWVAYLMSTAYTGIREQDPLTHFWHVTVIHDGWVTSDERTILRLSEMFDAVRPFLASLTGNFVVVAELHPFTNVRHADGGKLLSLHVHACVWGPKAIDIPAALSQWRERFQSPLEGAPSIKIDPIGSRRKDIYKIAHYSVDPPDKCKTYFRRSDGSKANLHESEKGDRFIRYHRLFEILSHVRLRQLFDGSGEGVRILESLDDEMPALVKRNAIRLIDREGIPDYWRRYRAARPSERRFKTPVIL